MKKQITFLLCVMFSVALIAEETHTVTLTNVTAAQTPGTKEVVITYDVAAGTPTVTVSLEVRDGDTVLPATTLSGDIGPDVATGAGRSIIWDAGADWNGNVATGVTFTVIADDGVVPTGGDPTATNWEEVNERWVKNIYADGAITMSDRTTNLMWLYDASMLGKANWNTAKSICSNLTYAGHSDWFLPNRWQLHAMYSQKAVFINVNDTGGWENSRYWSSTTRFAHPGYAYYLSMTNDYVYYDYTTNSFWVWSCRPGQ